MEKEKHTQMSFRLPEQLAREFRSRCVLNGVTVQSVLEQAARDYAERGKKEPE